MVPIAVTTVSSMESQRQSVCSVSYTHLDVYKRQALGSLIQVAGTDDVASAYASTYPIALVTVVLVEQMIVLLF